MKKKTTILILLCTVFQYVNAQIPVGGWREHLPYIKATAIVKAGNKIYCSTPYSLFYYNLNDNSVEKLSKVNGLSDIGVSTIAYNIQKQMLMVAYENANLDFIAGNQISNLRDIKNKAIAGNKKIYQIIFEGNFAYLACGFGVVVVDIDKKEIKDTYYIGTNASSIEVYGIAFDITSIYAATESGIYFADKNNPNLGDYNQWQKINTLEFPDGKYVSITNFESQLIVNYLNTATNTSILYRKDGTGWLSFYNQDSFVKAVSNSNGSLLIFEEHNAILLNSNLTEIRTISTYPWGNPSPNNGIIDENGIIYLADGESGLVISNNIADYHNVIPNSPYSNHVSDIDIQNGQLWVAGGGRNSFWGNLYRFGETYSFVDESWQSNILWTSPARDFVKILVNPQNPSQVYAGAWGAGLYVFENNNLTGNFNETNSTLQSIYPGEDYIRIGGLLLDEAQNLYVTNSGVSEPISVKTASGAWYSYNYPGLSDYENIGEIINAQYGHKWLQLGRGGGLFAFNDNATPEDMNDDEYRKFSIFDENGQVVTNEILSLAEDKEGVIWVGTDQGVFTYYNPQNVFSGTSFYADRIKVVDNKADTVVQYLLAKERVTAIAIDGANRKWFGTENSGAFLLSSDAQTEIFHFTTENSKLISNNVITIAIDDKSGEVFFGTDMGIVSFKGTATEGNNSYSGAYVYPNPVRENYTGEITITGLAGNVNVKITDISGQLVYETTAFGGQAIWNGKNFAGRKVNTGVYLVFCTDEKGEHKKVLKLLVIN